MNVCARTLYQGEPMPNHSTVQMNGLLIAALAFMGCMPAAVVPAVTLAPNALVDSTGTQIRIQLRASPTEAATAIVTALVERGISVTSNQGGVIEAKLPREMGWTGQYELVVRAYISPDDSSGARVLMYGEETFYNQYAPQGIPNRISAKNQGRALKTWRTLEQIGKELGSRP